MSIHTSPDPSSADTPRDPRALVDGLQKQAIEQVIPALDRALGKVDDYLFDRSQAGDDTLGLTALRDLRQVRTSIATRFEQLLLARFRELRDPRKEGGGGLGVLSLLSEEGLEEQLATEQLAESLTRMHAPGLELLGKRMAMLVGRDSLPAREVPLSPTAIAKALQHAVEGVEIAPAVRIVLFKFFERELSTALGLAYESGNALLVKAGLLPQLRPTAKAEPPPAAPAAVSSDGVADAAGPSRETPATAQPSPAEQAMFANVLGLLQGWRGALAPQLRADNAPSGPVQTLTSPELLAILSLLQRDLPRQLLQPHAPEQSLARQLRDEVVQGARKLGVPGDNLQLDGLDEDAVDLVALLFDVLLDGPQYDSDVRGKIGRMLVPYVKVAVKDRRMFMFKDHPARRLLNTVAEACEGNRGEAPQERELLNRVDDTINRLVADFNEDVAIFETLESELRAYMAQQRKRFELAEKRTAEAQQGRERLDEARAKVTLELAQRRGDRQLPRVMDEFLTRYVGHHCVQMILRDGDGSPRHAAALQATDALLLAFDYAELRAPLEELPALPRAGFEAILASSGCVGPEAKGAIDSLEDALARLARGESAEENRTRMPEQLVAPEPLRASPSTSPLELVGGRALLDLDPQVLERIRALRIGDWIHVSAVADRLEPAKISWISPISSRLLLVNRRGIRVLVASVEELAAMAKLGKVVLRDGDTPFEDAMQQLVGRLKAATNRG